MPLPWLTCVVTPQSRIRPGSQKRQVPAGGALPRRFVSPRGRVRHALSVGREKPRRVPAFGTRVWPDVSAEHVSLVLRFLGRVPRTTPLYDCRPILTPRLWRRSDRARCFARHGMQGAGTGQRTQGASAINCCCLAIISFKRSRLRPVSATGEVVGAIIDCKCMRGRHLSSS